MQTEREHEAQTPGPINDTEDKQGQVLESEKVKEGPSKIVIETANVTFSDTSRQTILERKAHISLI